MDYRVSQPRADLASAYASADTDVLDRPNLYDPFLPHSETISHLNSNTNSSAQRHYTDDTRLPSLPSLLPFGFDPFDQIYNSQSQYRRALTPSVPNFGQRQERSSRTLNRIETACNPFDSAPRAREPHSSTAPRDRQPPGPSSLTTHNQLPQPNTSIPGTPSDDYYLAALADTNFSSPSLPPFNSSPLPRSRLHSSDVPKPLEVGEGTHMTRPSRSRSSKAGLVDLTKEEPDLESTLGSDPITTTMPARKRNAPAASSAASSAASKRRRTSQSSPSASNKASKSRRTGTSASAEADSLFDDGAAADPANEESHDAIDLSNASEVPQELMAPKVDTRIKIGQFQCVICMDNCDHLTVTHCGHLFCSECLHSALHIDNMKKTCPVCRTKVDLKDKKGKNTKSFYHLELKFMTANKKGKRPAGPS